MDIRCLLPKLHCVEMTQTTSFPNENHLCRTPTHRPPSKVNPLMSGKAVNPWMTNQGINPVMSSFFNPVVTFIYIFQIFINQLMWDGSINLLTSTNTLMVTANIWVYEYVTYESLSLCSYAHNCIFDPALFLDLSFDLTNWTLTKSFDTYGFNPSVFSLPFHLNYECILHDWIIRNPFTDVSTGLNLCPLTI